MDAVSHSCVAAGQSGFMPLPHCPFCSPDKGGKATLDPAHLWDLMWR